MFIKHVYIHIYIYIYMLCCYTRQLNETTDDEPTGTDDKRKSLRVSESLRFRSINATDARWPKRRTDGDDGNICISIHSFMYTWNMNTNTNMYIWKLFCYFVYFVYVVYLVYFAYLHVY